MRLTQMTTNLYCPAGHTTAVGEDEPAGHAYPCEHTPLHDGEVARTDEPYVPALQGRHELALALLY